MQREQLLRRKTAEWSVKLELTEYEAFKLFQYIGRLPNGTEWAEPVYARLREARRRPDVGSCADAGR